MDAEDGADINPREPHMAMVTLVARLVQQKEEEVVEEEMVAPGAVCSEIRLCRA